MWRANIARKLHHQIVELRVLCHREDHHDPPSPRVCQLFRAVCRAPWESWHADPPVHLFGDGISHAMIRSFLDWADERWQNIYDEVIVASRHGLSQWRMALHDDIVTGKVGRLRHWLHGRQRLPLLTLDDQTLVHPQLVGQALREAWHPIFCPGDNRALSEEMVEYMTEYLQPVPWEPPPLDPQALQAFAMSKRSSSPGLDAMHLEILQKLPLEAWAYLTDILTDIENTGNWPSALLEVSLCAIPKGDSPSAPLPEISAYRC